MRIKVVILIAALVLGGLAAVLAAQYLSDARSELASEGQPISVLVAQEDIPRGMSADELLAKKMIAATDVPRRFTAAGAISSPRAIEGQVLAVPLTKGEQVTAERFEFPSTAGLAYSIPKGLMAVSIGINDVNGVSGLVKPGDHVSLYVTLDPGPDGKTAITQMLLPDSRVLALGASMSTESSAETEEQKTGGLGSSARQNSSTSEGPRTLTIAVTPEDAERVVYAEELGSVWCALLPASAEDIAPTNGQTVKTVLR